VEVAVSVARGEGDKVWGGGGRGDLLRVNREVYVMFIKVIGIRHLHILSGEKGRARKRGISHLVPRTHTLPRRNRGTKKVSIVQGELPCGCKSLLAGPQSLGEAL